MIQIVSYNIGKYGLCCSKQEYLMTDLMTDYNIFFLRRTDISLPPLLQSGGTGRRPESSGQHPAWLRRVRRGDRLLPGPQLHCWHDPHACELIHCAVLSLNSVGGTRFFSSIMSIHYRVQVSPTAMHESDPTFYISTYVWSINNTPIPRYIMCVLSHNTGSNLCFIGGWCEIFC